MEQRTKLVKYEVNFIYLFKTHLVMSEVIGAQSLLRALPASNQRSLDIGNTVPHRTVAVEACRKRKSKSRQLAWNTWTFACESILLSVS